VLGIVATVGWIVGNRWVRVKEAPPGSVGTLPTCALQVTSMTLLDNGSALRWRLRGV